MIRMQSTAAAIAIFFAGYMSASHAIPITGVTGTIETVLQARVSDNPNPPIEDLGSISGPQAIGPGLTAQTDSAFATSNPLGAGTGSATAVGQQSVNVTGSMASGSGSARLTLQQNATSFAGPGRNASIFQRLQFDTAANAGFVFRYAFTSTSSEPYIPAPLTGISLGDSGSWFEFFSISTRESPGSGTFVGTTRDGLSIDGTSDLVLFFSQQVGGGISSIFADGTFSGAAGFVWDLHVREAGQVADDAFIDSLAPLATPVLPPIAAVPEPPTIALLALGLGLLAFRARRRPTTSE